MNRRFKMGKLYAGLLTSVLLVTVPGAQAVGMVLLSGMQSAHVFEMTLLWDNGTSYRQYRYVDETQGICAMDAAGETGFCQVDLAPLAAAFQQISVVQFIPDLPESVHWGTDTPTPVILAAIVKEWDPASQRASQWQMVCSVLPDDETLSVCLESDRIDHFNYVIVQTDPLMSLIASLTS